MNKSTLSDLDCFSDFLRMLSDTEFSSIRKLSKFLGFENPSLISDVINKKRKPSIKIIESLLKKYKFDFFTKQYLWNLYRIETSEKKEDFYSENNIIKDFWKLKKTEDFTLTTSDLIVKTLIAEFDGGLTKSELLYKTRKMLSNIEVQISIEKLLAFDLIRKNDKFRFLIKSDVKVFNRVPATSMLDSHRIIDRLVSNKSELPFISTMFAFVDDDSILDIKNILVEACEKISLILIEQDKKQDFDKVKKLYLLYINAINTSA